MADIKITNLPDIPSVESDDILLMIDVSDETGGPNGTDKKATIGQVKDLLGVVQTTGSSTTDIMSQKAVSELLALKIFQSPTDGGLTEIQTRTVDAGEVYEVRKTSDDSLATIYSDKDGVTEIAQNGTSNVSDSAGVVEFFVADGDYYVEVDGVKSGFYISKKDHSSVSAMTSVNNYSTNPVTNGYYSFGDGGGAKYLNRGVGWPQSADGLINHSDSAGNFLELIIEGGELNMLQAGIKSDWDSSSLTGTDNTPIMQNAINYLWPFDWQGSVALTNSKLKGSEYSILVPAGWYMLGDAVKYNPRTVIKGVSVKPSFGSNIFDSSNSPSGAMFVPNFGVNKTNRYVWDAAPYDATGVRQLGVDIVLDNNARDSGLYTDCSGVVFENINTCSNFALNDEAIGVGDIHFGAFRVYGTSCVIRDCYIAQTLHGVALQGCWDVLIEDNLIQTFDSAISLYSGTINTIRRNYTNKLGDRRKYSSFTPWWWPDEDGGVFIDGDYDTPSSIVVKNISSGRVVISEHIQEKYNRSIIGELARISVKDLHSESITNSLFAFKGCSAFVDTLYTFQPSNRYGKPTYRVDQGKYSIKNADLGNCGSLCEYITNGTEIDLLGDVKATDNQQPNQGVMQLTPMTERSNGSPSVYFEMFVGTSVKRPVITVRSDVDNSNLDLNYGYDFSSALNTVEEAYNRSKYYNKMHVYINNTSSTVTSETFTGVPEVIECDVTTQRRFTSRTHTTRGTVKVIDSKVDISAIWIDTVANPFLLSGSCTVVQGGDSLINITSEVFKVASGETASLNYVVNNSAVVNSSGAWSDDASWLVATYIHRDNFTPPIGGWGLKTKVL